MFGGKIFGIFEKACFRNVSMIQKEIKHDLHYGWSTGRRLRQPHDI